MLTDDTPETSTADLITRDDGFNLGMNRESKWHKPIHMNTVDATPELGIGRKNSININKGKMTGKKTGKKKDKEAESCNSCEQVCSIF